MKSVEKSIFLFFSSILLFTSCTNFLEGSFLKKELEEKIAYEKSESVNIRFKVNRENSGSFLTGEKTVRVGYCIENQFSVASEYDFDGLSVTRSTDGVVLDKAVEITLTSSEFELDRGIYKYEFKLLVNEPDILVLAKCHLKTDNEKPVFSSVNIYNTEDKTHPYYHKLSNLLFSENEWFESDGITPKEEIFHANHVENIWVEIKGIDADSGIKQVCVKETLLKDLENNDCPENTYINYYGLDSENNSGFTLIDSITQTYQYNFNYRFYGGTEGFIKLEFSLIDNAGNESKVSDNVTYEVLRKVQSSDYAYIYVDTGKFYAPTKTNLNFSRFSFQQLPYLNLGQDFFPAKSFSVLVKYKNDSEYTPIVEKYEIPYRLDNTATIDSVRVNITEVKNVVNECFEKKEFMVDGTQYLDIKLCEWWENGTYKEFIMTNPNSLEMSGFESSVSDGVTTYTINMIDSYNPLGHDGTVSWIVEYTYQKDEESPAESPKLINPSYKNSNNYIKFDSNNFKFDKSGIYKFYSYKTYTYSNSRVSLYGSKSKPLVYYYNYSGAQTPAVTFPSKISATYSHNLETKLTHIDITADLPDVDYDYYFKLRGTSQNIFCTKNKSFDISTIANTDTYTITVVARDKDGRFLGESSAKGSLKVIAPARVVFGSKSQEYNTPESLIETFQAFISDGQYRYPKDIDYYFVPTIYGSDLSEDYVKANFVKYTYKNEFNDDKVHDRCLQYYGLENGSYYLYLIIRDPEDENVKYFRSVNYTSYSNRVVINKALIKQKPEVSITNSSVTVSIPTYSENLRSIIPDFYKNVTNDKTSEIISNFYLDENNRWILDQNNTMTSYGTNSKYTLDLSDLADKSDFAKLYVKYYYFNAVNSSYNKNSACFYLPVFVCPSYYKDGLPCDSKTWISVDNGKQVFCDAPTLVHTLYCPVKLTDTNTEMDAAYWEAQGQETGVMVRNRNFTYSDDNIAEVPVGNYYTTIIHFADGKVLMTPPAKKIK